MCDEYASTPFQIRDKECICNCANVLFYIGEYEDNCTGGLDSFTSDKRPLWFPNGWHIILGCESIPSVLITTFSLSSC